MAFRCFQGDSGALTKLSAKSAGWIEEGQVLWLLDVMPTTDDDRNPFDPPEASLEVASGNLDQIKEIIRGWEGLRLRYNLILLVTGLLLLIVGHLAGVAIWFTVFPAFCVGLGANACYFMGPLVEFYACAMFRERPFSNQVRFRVWLAGLLFSLGGFALTGLIGAVGVLLPALN